MQYLNCKLVIAIMIISFPHECTVTLLQYDELQKMSAKDVEELSIIREEKRTLSMTVENVKSELSQLQARVFKTIFIFISDYKLHIAVDIFLFSIF